MNRAPLLAVAAASLLLACQNDQTTVPRQRPGIRAAISDAGHGALNSHFFFLPPMVPPSEREDVTFTGTFDLNAQPVVQVCKIEPPVSVSFPPSCTPVAFFPFAGNFDPSQRSLIFQQVQRAPFVQTYFVIWRPDWSTIDPNSTYRVRVFFPAGSGFQQLGMADVQIVSSVSQFPDVWAGKQFVPMLQGGVLLIDFRIEVGYQQGAQCGVGQPDCVQITVGPNPTRLDITTPSGQAAISIPPGFLTSPVTLTIFQVTPGVCFSSSTGPKFLDFGCYNFSITPPVTSPASCGSAATASSANCLRVEVCPTMAEGTQDYGHLELFKADPDLRPVALVMTPATLITCSPLPSLGLGAHRVIDLARANWRGIMNALGRLVQPKPLYGATAMIDDGLGGLVPPPPCCSNIGLALPAQIMPTPGEPTSIIHAQGCGFTVSVFVGALHPSADVLLPLIGVPVTFTVPTGSTGVVAPATPVLTNASGIASATWTLATGANNSLRVSAPASGSPVVFTGTGSEIPCTP